VQSPRARWRAHPAGAAFWLNAVSNLGIIGGSAGASITSERKPAGYDVVPKRASGKLCANGATRLKMHLIDTRELDRLVRRSFPAKGCFSTEADLGLDSRRLPAMAFVHGGPDPYLDRPLDAWLSGDQASVSLYALLNRLCRSGVIVPGQYAVTRPT